MSLKNKINKSLIIGLTVSSVFVSAHSVYALNEDATKEISKVENKIELNLGENKEVKTLQQEIVTSMGLNIRKEASKDAEIVGCLTKNDVVTVLETKENWSKIQISENEEGWVNNNYTDNEKAKVSATRLNLRKEPSTEKEILDVLDKNTNLEILHKLEIKNKEQDSTETWYEVKVLDNESLEKVDTENYKQDNKEEKIGFVHGDYVLTESKEAKLEKEAKKNSVNKKSYESKKTTKKVSTKAKKSNKVVKHNQVVSSSNLSGQTITFNATAYTGDTITSTGTVPKWGTIAVDPSVIPYGTKVYIPMFNKVFIAEDCGGAIKGKKIDIFMNNEKQALNFGRRNIQIKILG